MSSLAACTNQAAGRRAVIFTSKCVQRTRLSPKGSLDPGGEDSQGPPMNRGDRRMLVGILKQPPKSTTLSITKQLSSGASMACCTSSGYQLRMRSSARLLANPEDPRTESGEYDGSWHSQRPAVEVGNMFDFWGACQRVLLVLIAGCHDFKMVHAFLELE